MALKITHYTLHVSYPGLHLLNPDGTPSESAADKPVTRPAIGADNPHMHWPCRATGKHLA